MAKSNVAKKYGWASSEAEESHRYLLPTVTSLLRLYNIHSVIDIGTGNGATLPFWLQQCDKVAAIEPDQEGFEMAKANAGADVRRLGAGDQLPPEWQSAFDGAISLEVVEHLFDPHQLVESCFHCVRPKGHLIISTPYHGYLKNLALAFAGKWDFHHHPLRVGGHVKFWSRKTLTELFEKRGFRFISFHGVGRVSYMWKSMILVFEKI